MTDVQKYIELKKAVGKFSGNGAMALSEVRDIATWVLKDLIGEAK